MSATPSSEPALPPTPTPPEARKITFFDKVVGVWSLSAILICALIGFLLQLVALVLTFPFDRNRIVTGRIYRRSAITATQLIPYWRFRVTGPLPKRWPRRTVVVSNHCSQADPFLISRLPWEMKWLGKKNLFRIPIIGWSMVLSGDIPVHRGNRDSAKQAMARCAEYLRRGMSVMIFPEGTRSKTDELLPFKTGAFRLAIEQQADVLPIAVHGTRTALPKHSWVPGRSRAFVTVGTPISTAGMTLDDVDALTERARAAVTELRETLIGLS